MDADRINALTEQVLAAAFEVANTLGLGFLEKVYERALVRELELRGIKASTHVSFKVLYKGRPVGDYFADVVVEDSLAVELKCVDRLAPAHTAQCINYLKACNRSVCLLLNFQRAKLEWKRAVHQFDDRPT